jgi:excisionase family DNA binding protein
VEVRVAIPEFFTRAEVAARLKIDIDTVDNAIKRGELRAIRLGRSVRIDGASITALAVEPEQAAGKS